MSSSTIELFKEAMKFSAGHFTIFSATERERLHGHNFTVYCALTGEVGDDGLLGDYGDYKRTLIALCRAWDEVFLLPERSPHLRLERRGERIDALFDGEVIPFLAKDVLVLPIPNVTIEELAGLLLASLLEERARLDADGIEEVVIKVSSGSGQTASRSWRRGA